MHAKVEENDACHLEAYSVRNTMKLNGRMESTVNDRNLGSTHATELIKDQDPVVSNSFLSSVQYAKDICFKPFRVDVFLGLAFSYDLQEGGARFCDLARILSETSKKSCARSKRLRGTYARAMRESRSRGVIYQNCHDDVEGERGGVVPLQLSAGFCSVSADLTGLLEDERKK